MTKVGDVPRGIEVLVKKAAVDPDFKALLLETRANAAKEIGLALEPAEAAMLDGVPAAQLEAIVSGTKVDAKLRPAFLGKAAAVMIAALGAGAVPTACVPFTVGIETDRPPKVEPTPEKKDDSVTKPDPDRVTRGVRPDRPVSRGIRPDRPASR